MRPLLNGLLTKHLKNRKDLHSLKDILKSISFELVLLKFALLLTLQASKADAHVMNVGFTHIGCSVGSARPQ